MSDYCFDYNPPSDHNVIGNRIILYQCHGMGQNQVGSFWKNLHNMNRIAFLCKSSSFCNFLFLFFVTPRFVTVKKTLWFWWLIDALVSVNPNVSVLSVASFLSILHTTRSVTTRGSPQAVLWLIPSPPSSALIYAENQTNPSLKTRSLCSER